MEFLDEEDAAYFMDHVNQDVHVKALAGESKSKPIIEHAFFDTRVLHKKQEAIQRNQERIQKTREQQKMTALIKGPNKNKKKVAKAAEGAPADPEKATEAKRQKKIQKAAAEANRKNSAKLLVDKAVAQKDVGVAKEALEAIKKILSRGMRSRLKRRLEKSLGVPKEQLLSAK